MSGEGDKLEVEEIQPDKDGKFPETVPWGKYVGVKETLGKAKDKVASLEEKLQSAISTEEHEKVKQQLEEAQGKLNEATENLKNMKEASVSEKRSALVKRGLSEEKVKDMSEEALNGALSVLEATKPLPDMSSGGAGGQVPQGSPMQLARQAYAKSNE